VGTKSIFLKLYQIPTDSIQTMEAPEEKSTRYYFYGSRMNVGPKRSNYRREFMRLILNPNRQKEIESDIKIYAIYNEILIEESTSQV
jgi:hypothetical protein